MQNSENPPIKRRKAAENKDEAQPYILRLPDECLLRIFQLLKWPQLIPLAQVCDRFSQVLLLPHFRQRYGTLSLFEMTSWTLEEVDGYLQFAGPYVRFVRGVLSHKFGKSLAECIGKHCTQIEHVELFHISAGRLQNLLANGSVINKLVLHASTITDRTISWLRRLPRLRILNIRINNKFTGKHFHQLAALEYLTLEQCNKFTSLHLLATCKALKHLKRLDIISCSLLSTGSAVSVAIGECHSLKWLTITSTSGLALQGPKLKGLELRGGLYSIPQKSLGKVFFSRLVQHQGEQLQVLRLYAHHSSKDVIPVVAELRQLRQFCCPANRQLDDALLQRLAALELLEYLDISYNDTITGHGVLHLLRNCRNLKFVNVGHCKNITDEFVFEAIAMLTKQAQSKRTQPLWLDATATAVRTAFVLDDPRYREASHILQLYVRGLTTQKECKVDYADYDYSEMKLICSIDL